MTCKDCDRRIVCRYYTQWANVEQIETDRCQYFKNKADFVEIPCRCKECEHFNNYNPDRTYCEEHSDKWGDSIVYVDEDDYCSFGIKEKEGAEE